MTDLLEKLLISIIDNGAVRLEGTWFAFTYSGDTKYHTHIFDKGEEVTVVDGDNLQSIVEKVGEFFSRQGKTTIVVPGRFNERKTMMFV